MTSEHDIRAGISGIICPDLNLRLVVLHIYSILLDVVGRLSFCSACTLDSQWNPYEEQTTRVGHRLLGPFGADTAPRKVRPTYPRRRGVLPGVEGRRRATAS